MPACAACRDFYQFANRDWLASHPIPPAFGVVGSTDIAEAKTQIRLNGILQKAASEPTTDSDRKKMGAFYRDCMNMRSRDAANYGPISPLLAVAANARPSNLGAVTAALKKAGVVAFFDYGAEPDPRDSTREIAGILPGGLGLPDGAFYTGSGSAARALRRAYAAHVRRLLMLLGDSPSEANAETQSVLSTETALANMRQPAYERRSRADADKVFSLARLEALAPRFAWKQYVDTLGAPETAPVDVPDPGYFGKLSSLLARMAPFDLRSYLRWQIVHTYAPDISTPFAASNFAFYGKTLVGSEQPQPRWLDCTRATNRVFAFALAKEYVHAYLSQRARAQVKDIALSVKHTFRRILSRLPWMSLATRTHAVEKIDAMQFQIAYPTVWPSYASLRIDSSSYAANLIAAARFEMRREVQSIGKRVDRTTWQVSPASIAGYYDRSLNKIVLTAGVLQPPFYTPTASAAWNYGAIGALIGHEMTHGFDDQGRYYGPHGNLKNWWTAADAAQFKRRAHCIASYWGTLSPMRGIHENGRLVESEELADLGGLTIAHDALLEMERHPGRRVSTKSDARQFFLAWAHMWVRNERPQFAALLAKTDVHGDSKLRVNGTVANMSAFARTWHGATGSPMSRPPSARCRLW